MFVGVGKNDGLACGPISPRLFAPDMLSLATARASFGRLSSFCIESQPDIAAEADVKRATHVRLTYKTPSRRRARLRLRPVHWAARAASSLAMRSRRCSASDYPVAQ